MGIFYLGTPEPSWLPKTDIPLFIAASRIRRDYTKSYPKAKGIWALDSNGFMQIRDHGKFMVSARQYAQEAVLWGEAIGGMQWASIQDYMCEDFILAKTGLTVRDHQQKTVDSYLELRALAPQVNWLPVVQGFTLDEYLDCVELYDRAGVDLRSFDVVGLGSVCRRQGTAEAEEIVKHLYHMGLGIHAFGFKLRGLANVSEYLVSSDSQAWSYTARKNDKDPECSAAHKKCSNCFTYAKNWYVKKILPILRNEKESPPMRYLGSKGLIAKHLAPIILKALEERAVYWEPFVGGFSMAKVIGDQAPADKALFASDYHTDLILLYQRLKAEGVDWLPDAVSEDEYKAIKTQPSSALRGFMGFGCAFGGKWLGTYARGEDRNYAAESKRSLAKILSQLKRFSVWQDDFTQTPETSSDLCLKGQMVIYCDPPYANTSGYSVAFDQAAFIETCLRLARWGNIVLVSEYALEHPLFAEVWSMPSQKRLQTKDRATVERLYRVTA